MDSIKLFVTLVIFLGFGVGHCNAGTYTSEKNPQHSVQYEEAPEVYLTVGQCKDYSRQNPDKIVNCRSVLSPRHFYLNGEIVDSRMDELAKNGDFAPTSEPQTAEIVFIVILILMLIGIVLYVYIIPTLIAYKRHHPQRVYIMLLNLFLGNTLVGWIAALIWARSGGEITNARSAHYESH